MWDIISLETGYSEVEAGYNKVDDGCYKVKP